MTLPYTLKRRLERSLPRYTAMSTDTANPNNASVSVFTVAGGMVMIHGLILTIGTVWQAIANNTQWLENSSATAVDVPLSLDFDMTGAPANQKYSVIDPASAIVQGFCMCAAPLVARPGTIDLNCNGTATGTFTAEIWWSPLVIGGQGESSEGSVVSAI